MSLKSYRLLFFILVIIIGLYSLFALPRLSLPLLASYLCYLVLEPFVPRLTMLGMKRNVAVLLIMLGILVLSIFPIIKLAPIISTEVENIQYYIPKIEGYVYSQFDVLQAFLAKKFGFEIQDKYLPQGFTYVRNAVTNMLLKLPQFLASLIEWMFLVPLLSFFMLSDSDKLKRIFLKLVPNSIFERFYYIYHQLNKQIGDYIFAKFVEASIVGFIITLGLVLLEVRFSLILGIVAAVTNIIPYVGPLLGLIPALLLGMTEYGWSPQFGAIMILYLVANFIDMAIVFPLLVSKIVDLHPVLVVVSVILGSQYLGVLGMIICIPIAAAFKLILIEIYKEFYEIRN